MAKLLVPIGEKILTETTKKTSASAAKKTNGKSTKAKTTTAQPDQAILEKVAQVRNQVRESFGKVVMAMMILPRYRHFSLSDLNHMVLEPLIRDRIAIAYPPKDDKNPLADMAGMAIWASVSAEVDVKIREQIKAGVFPVRLNADDWASGDINWLLDVIAPDQKMTASVIASFKQVVKDGDLRLHPVVTKLVDKDVLEKMGAKQIAASDMPTEGQMTN